MPAAFFEKSASLSSDSLPYDASPTPVSDSPCCPSETELAKPVASSASACSCQCPRWSRPRHWIYRGEGNASVVLALPQERKIVRLAKIDHKLRRMDSDAQFSDAAGARAGVRTIGETLERLVFSDKIFGPLLGAGLVRKCQVFHVDQHELDGLARELDEQRPEHRKHKRLAPVCHVIVCDDCTVLPVRVALPSAAVTFCVEIKPKQGFLGAYHKHCPFCLNQFLKKKHGKIQVLSQYCPLELFSGRRWRMMAAINALIRTPQNNLRIFQNGELVFADECQKNLMPVLQRWFQLDGDNNPRGREMSPIQHFCALVTEALLADLPDSSRQNEVKPTIEGPAQVEVETPFREEDFDWTSKEKDFYSPCLKEDAVLRPDCVLGRLLNAQKLGDVNFQELYEAYDTLAEGMKAESFSYERLRWTDERMTPDWLLEDRVEEADVRMVQRYRISSTARDCSIMITFQCLSEGETYPLLVKDLSGRQYKCNISVVDVDPKPAACVEKHRRRNLAMNEAFQEYWRV